MRFLPVFFILLAITGSVCSEVVIGSHVAFGSHIAGDFTTNITITLDSPVDGENVSHISRTDFTVNVSSIQTIENTTLYIWNTTGVWNTTFNDQDGNRSITFINQELDPAGTYTWGGYTCSTTECLWSENRTIYSQDYVPQVSLKYPVDGETTSATTMNFTCNFSVQETWHNVTLYLWKDSGTLYTETKDNTFGSPIGPAGGDANYTDVTISEGNYEWNCLVYEEDDVNSSFASANFSFTVTEPTVVSEIRGGCSTYQGYSYSYVASAAEDYISFNMTGISEVLPNMTNINSTIHSYRWDDYTLILNTTVNKSAIIYLGGSDQDFTHADITSVGSPSTDSEYELYLGDMTLQNNFYTLKIQNESDAGDYALSTVSTATITLLCDTHAPDTLPLGQNTTYYVSAFEKPLLHLELDDVDRKYETLTSTGDIDFFSLYPTDTFYPIDFTLEDYTGDFQDSYLQIYRNVDESLEKIWQKQWYNLGVVDVDLENNTYYQYVLYTPDSTRVIAWDKIVSGIGVTIAIKDPKYNDQTSYKDGVSLGFTTDYTAGTVGVAYSITGDAGSLERITFTVYNYTDNEYVVDYTITVSSGGDTGSITYTVAEKNNSYYMTAEAKVSGYTNPIRITDMRTPMENAEIYPFYDSLGIPNDMLGVDKDDIYTAVSMFLVTGIAMMFGAVNVALGGVITVGAIGVTYYFGWFRGMSLALYLFLAVMAVGYYMVKDRRRTE